MSVCFINGHGELRQLRGEFGSVTGVSGSGLGLGGRLGRRGLGGGGTDSGLGARGTMVRRQWLLGTPERAEKEGREKLFEKVMSKYVW